MSRIDKLITLYRQHLSLPWDPGIAAIQRVIFAVYDKIDELRLRAQLEEFRLATQEAHKEWLLIDLTNAFPAWMAGNEYRESYFECPDDLQGYPTGEIEPFVADLILSLQERIQSEAGPETVVALYGVGSLYGLARVSTVVAGLQESIKGRMVVFFPGEFHPEDHTYWLLDAHAGWNYLAVPLMVTE